MLLLALAMPFGAARAQAGEAVQPTTTGVAAGENAVASPTGIVPIRRIYNFNRSRHHATMSDEDGISNTTRAEDAAATPSAGGIVIIPPVAISDTKEAAASGKEAGGSIEVVKNAHAGTSEEETGGSIAVVKNVDAVAPGTGTAATEAADGTARETSAATPLRTPRDAMPDDAVVTIGKTEAPGKPSSPAAASAEQPQATARGGSDIETAAITPGPPIGPVPRQEVAAPLYLEVFINGHPTHLIAEFTQLPGGGFAARAKELDGLGIATPAETADDELLALKDLGARWRYDEAAQSIDITLPPEGLKKHVYDLSGKEDLAVRLNNDGIGMVLNYSLLAAARAENAFTRTAFDGISAQLEGWIYSPMGTLFSSGIVKKEANAEAQAIRLDTHWQFVDVPRAITYRVGDLLTSGPSWARPVRMGGVQVSRSFKVRPDVIATPLPTLSATAAVPTAIDVYVNNLKVHSGKVEPGPFEIANIPALAQGGVARLVMRDATGREIVREQSFYVSPKLLREGLLEYALSAGVPRRNFGIESFDYDWRYPGIAASMRYGLSNQVTLQAHAEAARDLLLGGAGVNFSLFGRALFSAAGAVSHSPRGSGFLTHVSAETRLLEGLHIAASSTRTWGDYADLASLSGARAALLTGTAATTGIDVPRAVESLNIGYALSAIGGGVSAGLVHVLPREGERTLSLNIGYNQRLFGHATFYANALIDLDQPKQPTLFAGITMPLGGKGQTLSASGTRGQQGGWRASLTYDKPLKSRDGAVGWRARVTYGELKSLQASLAWRSPYATVRGTAMQVNKASLGQLSVDGALVLADGAVFASNRIDDAFAIVNAGAAGVRVRYENREVGTTRGDGRLLVTSLRSLQRNKISIDPESMPVDAVIEDDKTYVVPGVRSGVVVKFNTKRATRAALVVLHDEQGKPIEPGVEVTLQGVEETFIVGYDGETYLDGLKARNTVEVNTGHGVCRASFRFTPGEGVQPRIGPLTCRMQ